MICALVIWNFPEKIAGFYFGRPEANVDAIALTVVFLHVAAAFQVVDGMQVSAALALRGLKDARAPIMDRGRSWLVGADGSLARVRRASQGLGIWMGLAFRACRRCGGLGGALRTCRARSGA